MYGNVAFERGSLVTVPGAAEYQEYGFGYASATTVAVLNAQRIGAQFYPVDSFVPQNDLTGYEWFTRKTINFSPTHFLHDVQVSDFYARYHNRFGQLDQTDASETAQLDFRNLITFKGTLSANGVQVADREFLPFDGNALYLGYKINTVTPTYVRHTFGKYYHGELDANNYVTVLPLRKRLNLTLEGDQDTYFTHYPGETRHDPVARTRESRLADHPRRLVRRRRAPYHRRVPAELVRAAAVRRGEREQRLAGVPPAQSPQRVLHRVRRSQQLVDHAGAIRQVDPLHRCPEGYLIASAALRREGIVEMLAGAVAPASHPSGESPRDTQSRGDDVIVASLRRATARLTASARRIAAIFCRAFARVARRVRARRAFNTTSSP